MAGPRKKGARTASPPRRTRPEPGAPPRRGRTALVALGVVLGFTVVAGQLVRLQVIEAHDLAARADDQTHKTVTLSGERGTITDRNGEILARNMDVPSLFADPSAMPHPRDVARQLARVLPESARTLERRLVSPGRHFAWLHRKSDPALARKVLALDLPGVHQVPESRRFYPKGKLLGHILGFAGMDNEGLSGIEQAFDDRLAGGRIVYVVERDALGRHISPSDADFSRPTHGADLRLTIDEVVQYHVERELDRAMETTHARGALAVAMDPDTGEVLAMAVRPEFDPNRAEDFRASDFRDRIITDPYEPGSVLKVFVAASALDAGVVHLDDVIDCENGTMPFRGGPIHDHKPYGDLTYRDVLVKSSNIGSAKVAMRLGDERLYEALRKFGFGRRTGVELTGESPGVLLPVSRWSGRSIASVAIGQEVMVTPLQLVAAASAVANGGWLMRPHVVADLAGPEGTTRTDPTPVRRVVSTATAAALREALTGVASPDGTAPEAALAGYRVAGKTGTAQKASEEHRGYAHGKYIASFLGMVPADDPRLVILVVMDEPEGRLYYGGQVAAPVFKAIAEPVLAYLGVHPETERTVQLAAGSPGAAQGGGDLRYPVVR
jgi:cell division protein FtsI (penicillin-binding protein 3)